MENDFILKNLNFNIYPLRNIDRELHIFLQDEHFVDLKNGLFWELDFVISSVCK